MRPAPSNDEHGFRGALRQAAAGLEARRARLDHLAGVQRALVYSYGVRGRDLALQLRASGVDCLIFDNALSALVRAAQDGFEVTPTLAVGVPIIVAAGQNQCEILSEVGPEAFSLPEALYAFDLRNSYDRARWFTDRVPAQAEALFAQHQALEIDSRADFLNVLLYRASLDVAWLRSTRRPVQEMWTPPVDASPIRSFCDVGAYDGDTLTAIKAACPELERSFTVEPNVDLAAQVTLTAQRLGLDNHHHAGGAWNRPTQLAATHQANGMLAIAEHPQGDIPADRLDRLTGGRAYDYVKLDVEATEAQVLDGAPELLGKATCIAVAAYHLSGDLLDLPRQLQGIVGEGWRWAFRHYSQSFDDSIYYIYR